MANDEERQSRLRALGAKAGGALPRVGGAALSTAAASIQQQSADIEIPALTKLMGKIGGFLGGGGEKIEQKLLTTNEDQNKTLGEHSDKLDKIEKNTEVSSESVDEQAEELEKIKESTEATADAMGEQLDLFEKQNDTKKRSETESKREATQLDLFDDDDDDEGEGDEGEKSGGWFSTILRFMMKVLPILSGLASVLLTDFETLGKKFRTLYTETIAPFITNIGKKFTTMMDETIKPAMKGVLKGLGEAFPGLAKFLTSAGVTDAARKAGQEGAEKLAAEAAEEGAEKVAKKTLQETGEAVTARTAAAVSPAAVRTLTEVSGEAADMAADGASKGKGLLSRIGNFVSSGVKGAGGFVAKGALGVLKKVPIIGPAIEAYFLSGKYDKLSAARDNGVITEEEYKKAMIVEVVAALGSLLGGTAGVVAGGGVASAVTGVAGAMAGEAATRYGAEQFLGVDSSNIFAKVDAASGDSAGGNTTVINNNNVDASSTSVETGSGQGGAAMTPSTGTEGAVVAH